MISKEDWIGRRLVADKFRDRRVFLCGDAAHLWVPMARVRHERRHRRRDEPLLAARGARAERLGRRPRVLDAYEAERLPITEQVSRYAMDHALALAKQRRERARRRRGHRGRTATPARAGRAGRLRPERRSSTAAAGSTSATSTTPRRSSPTTANRAGVRDGTTSRRSTVPGCRTPHLWLRGRALALRRARRGVHAAAAGPGRRRARDGRRRRHAADVPLHSSRRRRRRCAGAVRREKLVLSRPDQHVAWRGDDVPADPLALVDLLRGGERALSQLASGRRRAAPAAAR